MFASVPNGSGLGEVDEDGEASVSGQPKPKPNPKPKPIQLKEVTITATRLHKGIDWLQIIKDIPHNLNRNLAPPREAFKAFSAILGMEEGDEPSDEFEANDSDLNDDADDASPFVVNKFRPNQVISENLRVQKQLNEHTLGGKDVGGNSYLLTIGDAQSVLDFANSGTSNVLSYNVLQNRLYVKDDNVTGYYNNNGTITTTHVFLIKGGKSSTVVPVHSNITKFR